MSTELESDLSKSLRPGQQVNTFEIKLMEKGIKSEIDYYEQKNLELQEELLKNSGRETMEQKLQQLIYVNEGLEDKIFELQECNSNLLKQKELEDEDTGKVQEFDNEKEISVLKQALNRAAKEISFQEERKQILQEKIKQLKQKLEYETDQPYSAITEKFIGRGTKIEELQKQYEEAEEESASQTAENEQFLAMMRECNDNKVVMQELEESVQKEIALKQEEKEIYERTKARLEVLKEEESSYESEHQELTRQLAASDNLIEMHKEKIKKICALSGNYESGHKDGETTEAIEALKQKPEDSYCGSLFSDISDELSIIINQIAVLQTCINDFREELRYELGSQLVDVANDSNARELLEELQLEIKKWLKARYQEILSSEAMIADSINEMCALGEKEE